MVGKGLERVRAARRRLPENVRILGSISLANDAASELAYPIVPLFLTITLGAPILLVGLIEGIAEASAISVRFLSGWLSDRLGERRRPWILAGYGLSTVTRLVLAAAPAWGWVLGAKIGDRIGKGTRGTPRDALIRDSTPKPLLGAAFGYHRTMDTLGAVAGPLVAVALLASGLSLRTILFVAVAPGAATLVLVRRVREASDPSHLKRKVELERVPLPAGFWVVLGIWIVFSLGNSSDVFLLLRAENLGLGALLVVLAYAVYNAVQATLAWPLGALSDRVPRHVVLAAGTAVFALVYGGLALTNSGWVVWPLFALYGAYVAATEGVARAWVADQVGERAIGTAYGIFFLGTAAAALVASIAAGLLWTYVDPQAPFVLGAIAAAVASVLLVGYSLVHRAGALPAKLVLAGLGACVLFGAGFEHSSLAGLLRGSDAADALPLAPAQPCPAPAPGIRIHQALLRQFPRPAGLVYTGVASSGPSVVGDAYVPVGIAEARQTYEALLATQGYEITKIKREAIETDVIFAGSLTGEVSLSQTCRSRTNVIVRIGGKD